MATAGTFAFFGTPRFAAIILKRLLDKDLVPQLLVTNPDRPVGRKKVLTAPPTKQVVLDSGASVEIFQPEVLDEAACKRLEGFDYFVVAAYSKILPKRVLSLAKRGVVGVHPSLLPKFRGASPIQSALLEGATETGTTLYVMDEKVDHGAIIAQATLTGASMDTLTSLELEERLAELSAELLVRTLPDFCCGKIAGVSQADADATFTKKFATQDGFVEHADLTEAQERGGETARHIDRMIRALNPEPGVFTLSPSKGGPVRMKLLSAKLLPDGKLRLTRIQYEGKTPQELSG